MRRRLKEKKTIMIPVTIDGKTILTDNKPGGAFHYVTWYRPTEYAIDDFKCNNVAGSSTGIKKFVLTERRNSLLMILGSWRISIFPHTRYLVLLLNLTVKW